MTLSRLATALAPIALARDRLDEIGRLVTRDDRDIAEYLVIVDVLRARRIDLLAAFANLSLETILIELERLVGLIWHGHQRIFFADTIEHHLQEHPLLLRHVARLLLVGTHVRDARFDRCRHQPTDVVRPAVLAGGELHRHVAEADWGKLLQRALHAGLVARIEL